MDRLNLAEVLCSTYTPANIVAVQTTTKCVVVVVPWWLMFPSSQFVIFCVVLSVHSD